MEGRDVIVPDRLARDGVISANGLVADEAQAAVFRLLLRDLEGHIRVFHNVCSHRGVELVTQPTTVKKTITCPYHSWCYGLDGGLRATPSIGGPGRNTCEGFDKARHGLKPVRSAVWFDVVFVNLSGDAAPFEDYIAPLATGPNDSDSVRGWQLLDRVWG